MFLLVIKLDSSVLICICIDIVSFNRFSIFRKEYLFRFTVLFDCFHLDMLDVSERKPKLEKRDVSFAL